MNKFDGSTPDKMSSWNFRNGKKFLKFVKFLELVSSKKVLLVVPLQPNEQNTRTKQAN